MSALERGMIVAAKYRLEKPLGAGGMGSVWIAEQQPLGRNVAFKVLKRPSEAAEARFFREMQALARIQQPNVVTVYDSGRTEDGALYIAMELVDGPTLREELVARGRMTEENALAGIRQIAAGLAAAHERKIAHFDLKPENIVLHRTTHGLEVKILDFGIARILEDAPAAADAVALASSKTKTAGVTEEGVAVGTPGYMSPEHLLGVRDDVRSDLYALGVIWFELLTARAPFQGATTAEIAAKTLTESAPRPSDVVAGCASPATEALLATLLARDPSLRPKDAVELVHALDRLSTSTSLPTMTGTIASLSSAPSSSSSSSPPPHAVRATATTAVPIDARPPKRGAGRTFAIAAAVVVAVAAIGAVAVWQLRAHKHHDGPTRVAVLGFDVEKGDPLSARIVADTLAHSLAALPQLRVVSPLVVAHAMKVANGDSFQVGRDLDLDLAVTGTVRVGPPLNVRASLEDLDTNETSVAADVTGDDAGDVVHKLVPALSDLALKHSRVMPPASPSLSLSQSSSKGSPTAKAAAALDVNGPAVAPIKTRRSADKDAAAKNEVTRSDAAPPQAPGESAKSAAPAIPVVMASTDDAAEREYLQGMAALPTDLRVTERHLANAVARDPNASLVFVHLGLVRAALNGGFDNQSVRDAFAGVHDPSALPRTEKNAYEVALALTHGDVAGALQRAEDANRDDPEDPLAWALLGMASAANNDVPNALRCLEQSIDRAPDLGMTRLLYAHLLDASGKHDAAVKSLQKYLATHVDDVDAQAMLGAMSAPKQR